jgi:TrmH family RNA methyltransferase
MELDQLLASNQKSSKPLPVYGALLSGKSIHGLQLEAANFILIGNESKGIRENLMPFISDPISIPRIGEAESLNAAVAAGIILSHFKS